MSELKRQVIVAEFKDRKQAEHALNLLNRELNKEGTALHQGAVVTRDADGILEIIDVKDDSFKQLTNDAATLAWQLGAGSVRILTTAITASIALTVSSIGKAVNLAGSAAELSGDKMRSAMGADRPLRKIGRKLAPGSSALVVVVDSDRIPEVAGVLNKQPAIVTVENGAAPPPAK